MEITKEYIKESKFLKWLDLFFALDTHINVNIEILRPRDNWNSSRIFSGTLKDFPKELFDKYSNYFVDSILVYDREEIPSILIVSEEDKNFLENVKK